MTWWRDGRPADIVVDPDGSVWVSTEPTKPFMWASYVELEEIQSEGFDSHRSTFNTRTGRYRSGDSGRDNPKPRSYPHKSASHGGIRDHRPMTDEQREQARLYTEAMGYTINPDIFKNIF